MQHIEFSGNAQGVKAYIILLIVAAVLFGLLFLIALPGVIAGALARRRAEDYYNQRVNTVIAQYDPPQNLSPAEMGLLYDMKCDHAEIMATLFDLEHRKIIRILDSNSVQIIDSNSYASLSEYEKIAIRMAGGEEGGLENARTVPFTIAGPQPGTELTFNLLLPEKKSIGAFTKAVQRSLQQKGIPLRNYTAAFILRVFIIAFVLSLLPLATVAMAGTYNGKPYDAWSGSAFMSALSFTVLFGLLLLPIYIFFAYTVIHIWMKFAGRYWLNTRQARALWPELEGYKIFLEKTDLKNIQFESLDKGNNAVTTTLPYAMIFGFDTKWQQRLSDRAKDETPTNN